MTSGTICIDIPVHYPRFDDIDSQRVNKRVAVPPFETNAFRTQTHPPTAERLTPDIDWWADAEDALKQLEVINHASN